MDWYDEPRIVVHFIGIEIRHLELALQMDTVRLPLNLTVRAETDKSFILKPP